ncbi:c-type cytochrome [Apibacter muscae]|uniref:c-type cytochrome n=1 Tax=Apibacter muscae TaxID=2509004 RepID=UPI0011AC0184|nr:c-type cytochrome [Apibacter muscae]TWP25185.1 c-type cytochrome [Apibacter muscae]
MKKVLIVIFNVLLMVSCSNDEESKIQTSSSSQVNHEVKAVENTPPEHKGKLAIENSDCLSCHKENAKLIGPSFKEIADRYSNKDIDVLTDRIINGGKGNWGDIPMQEHPNLSKEEAKIMIEYILSLKKI